MNESMKGMSKEDCIYVIALVLVFVGAGLIMYYSSFSEFNDGSGVFDADLASKFGGFVGGVVGSVFSLSGVLLLYVTLIKQQKTVRDQQKEFLIQQFENRFFNALEFHRANVAEMTHRKPNSCCETVEGRNVFHEIRLQFKKIYKSIDSGGVKGHYPEDVLIDLAWLILFFGTSMDSRNMLVSMAEKVVGKDQAEALVGLVEEKTTDYDDDIKYYGGHQVRLGHYFRHLYQTIKYIDEQTVVELPQKKQYAKMLRAQLSTAEQAVLFINSLSQLGKPWRFDVGSDGKSLMECYEMIKNIPENYTWNINPKGYYPNIDFETW